MISKFFIDADSLPKTLRPTVLRACIRINKPSFFVADRSLSDVVQFIAEDTHRVRQEFSDKSIKSKISMVVVPQGQDSADNYIVENADSSSLCITHDIPLASRLLQKGCKVIDDRGNEYRSEDICVKLADRDVNAQLREAGVFIEVTKKQTESNKKAFADSLDRLIRREL